MPFELSFLKFLVMKTSSFGFTFALLGTSLAAPHSNKETSATPLDKRDVCDGINATPVLYQDYWPDSCPPINTMNSDGTCPGQNYDTYCASVCLYSRACLAPMIVLTLEQFCQVRTYFTYGQEAPVENSYCRSALTCTITDTVTKTITGSASANANWEWGFKMGITAGISRADATAHARAFSRPSNGGCGYFSIVPVWRNTCGTMTEGYYNNDPGSILCAPQTTTENVCTSQQRLNQDGTVDAETIFVWTDCNNREPLPADQQDPIYNQPGVALDRGKYSILAENWGGIAVGAQGFDYSTAQCGANKYSMPVADVWTASNNLDAIGDQDCCTPDAGGCANVMVVNHNAVDLCAPEGQKLCANCARVGNYVAGLTSCVDENNNVGAKQDIVETPGLSVQI